MKVLYAILIAVLLAGCGPSAEQIAATATIAQAQTQTAAPTLTPTFTPTITLTPTQTLTPTPTSTNTPEPTSTLVPLNLSLTRLDGTWYGLTSEGNDFEITIKSKGVRSILVGFKIPGCEAFTPISTFYGTPKYFMQNNTLSMSDSGIVISGSFGKDGNASGEFEIKMCDGTAKGTWVARYETKVPPSPALLALVPNTKIPDNLYNLKAGAGNISELEKAIDTQSDWLLVQSFNFFFALPAGWKTVETGKEVDISFSPSGNADKPSISIRIGGVDAGNAHNSKELMDTVETNLKNAGTFSILQQKVVDPGKGYFLLSGDAGLGKRTILLFLSEDVTHPGFYFRWLVYVDPQDWNDYYPIVKVMIEHWVDLDLKPLGTTLPNDLGK